MAADLYISYAQEDKNIADAICAFMESDGIRCFYMARDFWPSDPEERWQEAVRSSQAMVVVFTDYANVSDHVKEELAAGIRAGIPIIPFKRTNAAPSGGMKYYLSTLHWLDVTDKPLTAAISDLKDLYKTIIQEGKPTASTEGASEGNGREGGRNGRLTYPEVVRRRRIIIACICGLLLAAGVVSAITVSSSRKRLKEEAERQQEMAEQTAETPTETGATEGNSSEMTEETESESQEGASGKGSATDEGGEIEIYNAEDEELEATYDNGYYIYSLLKDGSIVLHEYLVDTEELVSVPQSIGGKPVRTLGRSCFSGHEEIKTVILPEGLKELGYKCFWGCSSLREMNFPESLEILGGYCFAWTGFVNVVVPDTVKTMKYGAFCGCKELETAVIGTGVKNIDYDTFRYDSTLVSVEIPSNVETIHVTTFYESESVTVTGGPNTCADKFCEAMDISFVPDESLGTGDLVIYRGEGKMEDYPVEAFFLTSYREKEFSGEAWENLYIDKYFGEGLKDIVIPDTINGIPVGGIGEMAFCENSEIETVVLPETVQNIEHKAFYSCTSLKSINFPESLKCIGNASFSLTALENITVPGNLEFLSSMAFYNCRALKTIFVEDGIKELPVDFASSCEKLEWVRIPESAETINIDALKNSTQAIIYGKAGSYAEKYAIGMKMEFREEGN